MHGINLNKCTNAQGKECSFEKCVLKIYLSQGGSYTTIKLIKYSAAMAEMEAIRVPRLWDKFPCLVLMPESCVTTQKAESLAWEMARAPAPIASVVKTFSISVSSPRGLSSGATMDAVVIMATVVDPWAHLSPNARRKGRKRPQLAPSKAVVTEDPIPEF